MAVRDRHPAAVAARSCGSRGRVLHPAPVSVAVDGDRRTDGPPLGRAGRWVLVGIAVLLGAALSGYRLLWGLDDRQFFFDESIWSMRIDPRSPPEVRRAPGIALVYPTLYEYA